MKKVENRWSSECCVRGEGCDEDGPVCSSPSLSNSPCFVLPAALSPVWLHSQPCAVSFVSIWVCIWQIPLGLFNMASRLPPVIQLAILPQHPRLTLTHQGSRPGLSQGLLCRPALPPLPASHSYQLACTPTPCTQNVDLSFSSPPLGCES